MGEPDRELERLEELLESDVWTRPGARDLTLWLVSLSAPDRRLSRVAYAVQVGWQAIIRRRRVPRV